MAAKPKNVRPVQTEKASLAGEPTPVEPAARVAPIEATSQNERPVVDDPGETMSFNDLVASITGDLPEGLDDAMGLDDDPDTSLMTSLFLHLMSEHFMVTALELSETEALACHLAQHDARAQRHHANDLRFRPGRALAGLILAQQERDRRELSLDDIPTQNQRV